MAKKSKTPKPPKTATNVTYAYAHTYPQEVIEDKNEVVLDLQNGYIKVLSSTESLTTVIKTVDKFAKKITGPDIQRYVT